MPRLMHKAFVDDDGREIRIEHRGTEAVFKASDKYGFVNEGIERPA